MNDQMCDINNKGLHDLGQKWQDGVGQVQERDEVRFL